MNEYVHKHLMRTTEREFEFSASRAVPLAKRNAELSSTAEDVFYCWVVNVTAKLAGGDAPGGDTRFHSEHDG